MGNVIPLFREQPPPGEPWNPYVVLTEEMQESVVGVTYDIETLWGAASAKEFTATMRTIKERVSGWPDG